VKRIALLLVLVAAGVGAGIALARGKATPIGTGVVVIDTNLAYEGGQAAGTGMVLTSSGEVLTNNHVISGATTLRVVVPGTGRSYSARVVGYSVSSDVAVLQLNGASSLKTVSTAAAEKLAVGQAVKAVGNAGGTGRLSTTQGSITALQRTITASDGSRAEQLSGLIETSAALQPGDSGGPLLDGAGRVVGMDTAAATTVGYGFQATAASDGYAIPIGKALAVAKQITAGRSSATVHVGATAFLGVQVASAAYDGSGAVIAAVVPGGPADAAGLVPGDVITAVGGKTVSSPGALSTLLLAMKPGTKLAITFVDQTGATGTTQVTLGSGPPQ
jgi:S1-C subfamily serine protease